jgi:hypothetical protein
MAIYDAKPSKYEAVGNGSYLYRWNIEEIQVPDNSDSETTVIKWQCEEVTVWSPVTSNKITEAVIILKWDNNYEQKLVNDYNAAKLGVYGSTTSTEATEKVAAYTAYLNERKALKEQIDADCAELGIL